MLFSGLRSAEVLGLEVTNVDVGRGWVRVVGKGDKERSVPLDPEVASLIQSYLLAERPETTSKRCSSWRRAHIGASPSPGGVAPRLSLSPRARRRASRPSPRPAAHLRTALAEAGVDLLVMQALMGHDHADSSAAYVHLAPVHLRASYDAAALANVPSSPDPAALLDAYAAHLEAGGGKRAMPSVPPGSSFALARPGVFAAARLEERLSSRQRWGLHYLLDDTGSSSSWIRLPDRPALQAPPPRDGGTDLERDVERFAEAAKALGFARERVPTWPRRPPPAC